MTRFHQSHTPIALIAEPGYEQLRVLVRRSELERLLLEVSILCYGLDDRLVLDSAGQTVEVTVADAPAARRTSKRWSVSLSIDQLDALVAFLLVYFRDGAADVDHLDLQVTTERDTDMDLTVVADGSKPYLTPTEARKALGDFK